MIYRKHWWTKTRYCDKDSCGKEFEDKQEIVYQNSNFFGSYYLCKECHAQWIKECKQAELEAIERSRQRKINQKRADYQILAEEIVKVLMRGDTA